MVHFLQNRIRNFKLKRGVKINTSTKGSLIIFLAAACYSTGAVLVKFAYMEGLSAMTITMIRMIFAALLTGPIYICYTFRFRLGWKAHIPLLIAGLLNISMSLLLTLALQVLSASVTILLLYLYPIFTAFLAFALLKEKLSTVKLIALTGAVIGVALIVSAPRATVNITGAIMAIAAAMINATMVVTIKKTVVKIPPLISSAAMLTWGALVMSSIGLALRIPVISGTSTKGFMIIQALAVIPTVFSVSLLNKGLSLAEASHSSIIMTSEPLLNAVLAAVLLNEKLTLRQSLGGAVIICSLLLLTIGDHRREKLKNQLEEPQDVLT